MRALVLSALLGVASAASSCISSGDASIKVCIDSVSGMITSVQPLVVQPVGGGTVLDSEAATQVGATVVSTASDGSVNVTRTWQPLPLPHAPVGVNYTVTDAFTAGATSIEWSVTITAAGSPQPWSVPIQTAFHFGPNASALKLWAPWDRDSENTVPGSAGWVDPLQPSDLLPGGWWTGEYRYGNPRSGTDFIVAPLWTVLAADPAASDTGFMLHLSPQDPYSDTMFNCYDNGDLIFTRNHLRFSPASPITLQMSLVAHAADWRAAMQWSLNTWLLYWAPENPQAYNTLAGTGSYSWWLGALNTTELDSMDYSTNWDLSGRFFPWMGMYLPPVSPGDVWQCDPEGTQPVINVTYELIGQWYRTMAEAGYTDLSYFNVNEFGLNIVLPPGLIQQREAAAVTAGGRAVKPRQHRRQPVTDEAVTAAVHAMLTGTSAGTSASSGSSIAANDTCADNWQNASACMISHFLPSLVTHSWDEIGKRTVIGPYYSWQNAVVVDPGTPPQHAFMLEQMLRHIVYEDAFMGVAVDRSDWMDTYNCAYDDGRSFVPEAIVPGNPLMDGVCASMKASYADMIADVRATMNYGIAAVQALRGSGSGSGSGSAVPGPQPVGQGLMTLNRFGNARLDIYQHYDGVFSEGNAVNGAGLLAAASPGILWTYDAAECCSTPAATDAYFQAHLYMGIAPMLPFPGNDHAIPYNASIVQLYAEYGALFRAVTSKMWLLEPHIVAVHNASDGSSSYGKVNAFVTATQDGAAQTVVLVVAFGAAASGGEGAVAVNLTGIDRAWSLSRNRHPLLRTSTSTSATSASSGNVPVTRQLQGVVYVAEALWPARGGEWSPLANSTTPSWLLQVPVHRGAAVVRITQSQ